MNTRLIKILEESIRKHGDKPLTLSHLANMLKMEDRMIELDTQLDIEHQGKILHDIMMERHY